MKTCSLALGLAIVGGLLSANRAQAAEGQYINLSITKMSNSIDLNLMNPTLPWGKFHDGSDAKNPRSAADVCKTRFVKDTASTIFACGANSSASGCEGTIDFFDGTTKIGTFSWDSPYGLTSNKADWSYASAATKKKYSVAVTRTNKGDSGALGPVDVTVAMIAD